MARLGVGRTINRMLCLLPVWFALSMPAPAYHDGDKAPYTHAGARHTNCRVGFLLPLTRWEV